MSTEAEKLEAMVQAMVSALNINKGLRRKIADLERKLAEKDAEINHLTYSLDKTNADHVAKFQKQQAVIEKLKEQRNKYLDWGLNVAWESSQPLEWHIARLDAELAELGE